MSNSTYIKYNERAPAMFGAIKANVNLFGAEVLDLGCGYGDLALMSLLNGARHVTIVDKDPQVILIAQDKIIKNAPEGLTWESIVLDIDDRSELASLRYFHVAYCTSVLPYLRNKDMVLSFLAKTAAESIIEMQYYGDGPGPANIRNDEDMKAWLTDFWPYVAKIGQSYTGRKPAFRSIWKCAIGGSGWQDELRPRLSR